MVSSEKWVKVSKGGKNGTDVLGHRNISKKDASNQNGETTQKE